MLQCLLQVVNQIPTVIAQLLRENSDSSHTCLQMVVNMSCAMVAAFPRNDNMYDPLIRALKVPYLSLNYFCFETVFCPQSASDECM
jgi:hypothetical protein